MHICIVRTSWNEHDNNDVLLTAGRYSATAGARNRPGWHDYGMVEFWILDEIQDICLDAKFAAPLPMYNSLYKRAKANGGCSAWHGTQHGICICATRLTRQLYGSLEPVPACHAKSLLSTWLNVRCNHSGVAPLSCSWDTSPQDSSASAATTTTPGRDSRTAKQQQKGKHTQQQLQQQQNVAEPSEVEHDYDAEFFAQWEAYEKAQQERERWRPSNRRQQQQPEEELPPQGIAAGSTHTKHQEHSSTSNRRSFQADQEELMLAQADAEGWRKQAEQFEQQLCHAQLEKQSVIDQLAAAQTVEADLRQQLGANQLQISHLLR